MDTEIFCLLHRCDPDRNIKRFYLVTTGPSLLEPYAVWRFWGRIGGFQRQLLTPCGSAVEARRLADRLIKKRLQRGYRIVREQGSTVPPVNDRFDRPAE